MKFDREFTVPSVAVALAAMVGMVISASSFVNHAIGLYIVPLTQEFGWSRTEVSAYHIFYSWTSALLLPFSGKIMDKFGVRRVVLPGMILLCLALFALGALRNSLYMFYGLFVLIGICSACGGGVSYSKVVSGWFHNKRGMVLALISVGAGLAGAAVPLIAGALMHSFGWRGALMAMGALVLVLGLPTIGPFLRESPVIVAARAAGRKRGAGQDQALGVSAAEARISRPFLLCLAATAMVTLVNSSVTAHIAPLMHDRGISVAGAATVLALISVGGTLCRILEGWLLDRVNSPRLAIPFVFLVFAGLLMFHYGSGITMYMVGAFLIGAGVAAEVSLIPYFFTRYFGLRAFAEIYGTLWAGAAITAGLGPFVTAIVFDASGSYSGSFWAAEIVMVIIAICFLALPAYRFPARLAAFETPEEPQPGAAAT